MQFTIDRAPLLKALAHVQTVVEQRGTIPVLANVKIEGKGDSLTLTATDIDIALSVRVNAGVAEGGATTVPAHMFYDIARKLPEGSQVEVSTKDSGRVSIRAGSSRFTLS